MKTPSRLGAALRVAATEHHLLSTATLRSHGMSSEEITELCRAGVLERIIRGLYRICGTRNPIQDVAATLSRHRDAVASHVTALFLHDLDVPPPSDPQFTLEPGRSGRTSLGNLHRSPIAPIDRTLRHGLPVTTVARSLVDAAEVLAPAALHQLIDQAIGLHKTRPGDIEAALARVERAPGRIGSGRMRTALARWTDSIRPDSPAEAAAIRRILDFGLPTPTTQHEIVDEAGAFVARVDFAWVDDKVAREYDSDRYHGPDRIEADEIRRRRLEELGWRVGSIGRTDLRPGALGWLRSIERDLRGRRSVAS